MVVERDHGIRRCPGLRMFIARAIFCVCSVLHTFQKSCFEYERDAMHSAGVPRRFSTGTEESLHCGTEDESVLPVLLIAGPTQSGSELRPMPRPVHERVRKAFTAAGLHVLRGGRKGHNLVPFFVVRLLENFSPCQERRVCDGENGIGGGLVNAVGESDWINYGGKRDRFAQQPFGKK